MSAAESRTVKSVCPYCGVGCGIVMEVANDRILKVTGDKSHPTNFGRLCTKGATCLQAVAVKGRQERALMRHERGAEPEPVALGAAIAETARRLRGILDAHGPDAISLYVSGQMSIEAQYLANKLAKGFIRTRYIESNSRLCMAGAGSGYKLSLGADGPPGSYQDMDRTDLFFVIGANMADCHPILYLRMMDRVKAGAKLIVVDPRRTTTAEKAGLFLQIRPGTDLAFMNGLLHLLVRAGFTDPDFIARFTEGWEAMPAFLEDYPPEKVSEITGITVEHLHTVARWIGEAGEWMTCWTMGLNQSIHGTWNTNAICNLHLATGKICRPGSGPFSLTGQPNAMGGREMGYMGPGLPGQRSALVSEDRAFAEALWQVQPGTIRGEANSGTIGMFEEMRAGEIKACWIICTNPVATVANRSAVIEALETAELVITQDAFADAETNAYADIQLPGALWAEADGVMVNSERNMTLMPRAVMPPGDAIGDWEIIARVARAMGYEEAFDYHSAAEVFEEITRASNPETGYDLRGVSHERLAEAPLQWPCPPGGESERHPIRYLNDGVSQRKWIDEAGDPPRLAFPTASRRAIFHARPHLPQAEMPDEDFPFVLNTGRLQHQWHTLTKTGKIATLNKLNPGPFIEIHPEDAAVHGIVDGDSVEVRSRRGHAVLPAVVTDRVLSGNCFAPFHWNDSFGPDLAINAVTHDAVDPYSLQPGFKFTAVSLMRIAAKPAAPAMDSLLPALPASLGIDPATAPVLEDAERRYLQGFIEGLRSTPPAPGHGVPVLPAGAPFSPANRYFVDGLLAGMYSRLPAPSQAAEAEDSPGILILWASQTGNAEGFAAEFATSLRGQGLPARLLGMDAVGAADIAGARRLVCISSTFGDGAPPDMASRFWALLKAETAPRLEGKDFAVLAFGDSSYDRFCGFGKDLDARLEALGANRLLSRVDCEPDFRETAQAWIASIIAALGATADGESLLPSSATKYDRSHPYLAPLLVNRVLNAEGAEKETRQIAFDLRDSGLTYEAGDALGVWPVNCAELVEEILFSTGLDGGLWVEIAGKGELPLFEALRDHHEIARITPELLQLVAERSGSPLLLGLLKEDRKSELKQWLWGRQIADLLHEFPVKTTAAELVSRLKRLQPRLYSISSSPKAHPGEVHLTISTVRYQRNGSGRKGVCSTFLADRATEAPIFVQRSAHFRPPQDPAAPMIMVGPGTGVAPFRAFLHERKAMAAPGRNWLFFGEQRSSTDFYYREELADLQRGGYLHRLDTAFSRDQERKIYVQHRMIEHGAELWRWLQGGASFFVCGDASRMAKDVDEALRAIVRQHGGLSEDAAAEYVAAMAREKRYVRDVY